MIRHSQRRLLLLTAAFALSLLSCGREVTGPGNGLNYGRARTASLALDPHMPSLFAQLEGASDVVPFERVRILLLRDDATVALDTLVDFPASADSLALTLTLPLPLNTPDDGLPLALSMAYINAQGDTVFRAGPSNILALPVGSTGSSQPITLPVRYDGVGAGAAAVVIAPDSLVVVAGTASVFTAEARDGQGTAIPNTPLLFFTLDSTRALVADPGVGAVTWLPVRGTARIVAALPDGARADTAFVTVELPASQLVLESGNAQAGPIGAALAQPLVARVLAADGVPVAGVEVVFAVAAGGGSLSVLTDTSDANGDVQTLWTLGTLLGSQSVTATADGLAGSPLSFTATAGPGAAAQLTIVAQPAAGTAGAPLTPALTVAVQDSEGNTVPTYTGAVSLSFEEIGDATLGGTATVNAVAGLATFADLTIDLAGSYALVASSDTLPVVATAPIAIAPAAAAATEIVVQPVDGVAGVVLPAFSAVALDAFSNVATGFVGVVTITAQRAGLPANVLVAGDTVTAIDGLATFDAVRIDSAGTYTLVLDFGSIGTITTTAFTVAPAAASTIALLDGDGQTGVVAVALPAPLRVRVTDDFGNGVGGVDVTWNVDAGLAALSAPLVPTDADGIAATTVLVGLLPSTLEISASAAGLTGSPVIFTANATAGAAAALTVETEPAATAVAGETLAPIVVAARDAQGNIATGFVGTVTVEIATGVVGATLGGPVDANAVAGVATFDQLVLETVGAYTLRFTAPGLTESVSAAFDILPAAAFAMQLQDGDVQTGAVATALANPLRVAVLDVFGNGVPGLPVGWTITTAGGSLSADTTVTGADGIAGVTLTLPTIVGAATVEATVLGLNGSPVVFTSTALAGPAVAVVVTAAPDTVAAGSVAAPIVVEAQDAFGNVVTTFADNITLTATDAPGTFAAGTPTRAAVAGIATFDDLVFNETGAWVIDVTSGALVSGLNLTVVAGAPASFTIVAGNAQVGIASTPLPLPLTTRVTDAIGNAVSGATVVFTMTSGGGTLTGGGTIDSVITNAAGDAATTWTLGPDTLAAQTVQATLGALPALDFTATAAPNIANRTWTGAASTLWTDAANWAELAVPTATDSVRIPAGATFMPELAGNVAISRLTIEDGATLNVQSQLLTVTGNLTVPTALAILNIGEGNIEVIGPAAVRGALPRLTVASGNVSLGSQVDVSGNVFIVDGGDLAVGAQTLLVAGLLQTESGGTLTMTGPGTVAVDGDANFLGGSTAGRLTAGELVVGGNLSVTGLGGPFAASATHRLRMDGRLPTTTVTIADPANNPIGTFVVSEGAAVTFGAAGAAILGTAIVEGTTATVTVPSEVAIAGGLIDSVGGRWTGGTTRFLNDNPVLPVAIGGTVTFAGAVTLTDSLNVGAELRINQPTGVLDINGHRVRAGEFQTSEGGRLVMDAAADSLLIAGAANFSGGVSTLTAGYLEIGGSLFQGVTTNALQAGPAHETRLVGATLATLGFTNPGFGATESHLGRLVIAKSTVQANIDLGLDVFVNGVFEVLPLQFYTLTSGNSRIVSRGANLSDITFVNTRWEILDGAPIAPLSNITFTGMDIFTTQLRIARSGGVVELQSPVFATIPDGGFFLVAEDVLADADALTINVTAPTPTASEGAISALGGAVITGWPFFEAFNWTGLVGNAWENGLNWAQGIVPGPSDSAFVFNDGSIPEPIITTPVTVRALVKSPGFPIQVNAPLTVTDWITTAPAGDGLTCGAGGELVLAATDSVVFGGSFGCRMRVTAGRAAAIGITGVDSVVVENAAQLDIRSDTVDVFGAFRTVGGGTLRMQDALGFLQVFGEARFEGGSTDALLTDGTVTLYGDFVQAVTPTAYLASGGHFTRFVGTGTQNVSFANPDAGPAGSRFAQMTIAQGEGGTAVSLNSDVFAQGQLFTGGGSRNFSSALPVAPLLQTGGATAGAVNFTNVRWGIVGTAALVSIGDITFSAMATGGAPQMSIARGLGTVTITNATYDAAGTGEYLSLSDPSGVGDGAFGVTMVNPSPAFHGGRAVTDGVAVLTGWASEPTFVWVSTGSPDWTLPANWSSNVVPDSTSTVDIPLAAAVAPIIPSGTSVASLGVATALPVQVSGTLTVTDNLFVPITVGSGLVCTDTARVRIAADGAPSEFRGRFACLVEVSTGEARVSPTVYADSVLVSGTGLLDLAGGLMDVDSTFRTAGDGRLRMVDPADRLTAFRSVLFQGGSTTGLLTNGIISVNGGVFQSGSPSSLDASGNHLIQIQAPLDPISGNPTITITNPDSSGLGNVEFIAGRTELNTLVPVRGNATLTGNVEVATLNGLGGLDIDGNLAAATTTAELTLPRVFLGGTWQFDGLWGVDSTYFTGVSQSIPILANGAPIAFNRLEILGSAVLASAVATDTLQVIGDLFVRDGGQLTIGAPGQFGSASIAGDLVTEGTGVLVMQEATGIVNVAGTARFGGGSTEGLLTAGLLNLTGPSLVSDTTFIQLAGNSGSSFAASGTHVTAFTGGNQSAYFATPGYDLGDAHFGQLRLNHIDGQLALYSDAFAEGQVRTVLSFENITAPLPQALHTRGADLPAGLSFNNVSWVLTDGEAVSIPSSISFSGMAPSATQFTVARAGGTVTVADVSFGSIPTTGLYLRASDTAVGNGDDLVVALTTVAPATSGGFALFDAPASITGWDAAQGNFNLNAWTGAVDGNWSTAGNWSLARAPLPTDSVVIDLPGAYTVSLNVSATVAYLDVGDSLSAATPTLTHAPGTTLQVDSISVFYPGSAYNLTGGATLAGGGSMLVFGDMVFDGASMTGDGVTAVSAGGTGTIAGTGQVSLTDRALVVSGQATVGAGGLAGSGLTSIGITDGGLLDFQAANSLFLNGETDIGMTGGTLRISPPGAGVVRIDWPVSNVGGRIEVASGTLDLREQLAHAGTDSIIVRTGATLLQAGLSDIFAPLHVETGGLARFTGGALGGTHIFSATSSVSGPGSFEVDGATLVEIGGAFDIGSMTLSNATLNLISTDTAFVGGGAYAGGGFLNGTGVLAIRGAFSSTFGNPNGTGTIAVLPGGTLTLNSPLRGWNLDVAGTLVWGDNDLGLELFGGQNPQVLIRPGGLLDIQHGATAWSWFGSAANTLTNNGTIRKSSGAATATIVPVVSNPGVIETLAGTLSFPLGCTNVGAGTGCP